ncbi:MAG: hypothetical protein PHQ23_17070 [Candidatus Wallbacteria bacterium]|nr:hypothetical protein [Candidatus Wallbacteria bacterium]
MRVLMIVTLIYVLSLGMTVIIISLFQKKRFSRMALVQKDSVGSSQNLPVCREEQAMTRILSLAEHGEQAFSSASPLEEDETIDLDAFKTMGRDMQCLLLQRISWSDGRRLSDILVYCLNSRDFHLNYFALKLLQKGFATKDRALLERFLEYKHPLLEREALKVLAGC